MENIGRTPIRDIDGRSATPAIEALRRARFTGDIISYEHSRHMERGYALDTVQVLGVEPDQVFKTLMIETTNGPAVALVPASARLNLRALARAAGAKSATMMDSAKAEKITGYVTGGISPLGQKKNFPTFVDDSALTQPTIVISAGKRTLSASVEPRALIAAFGYIPVPVATRD